MMRLLKACGLLLFFAWTSATAGMSVPLMGGGVDLRYWDQAASELQAALECRKALQPSDAVRSALRTTNWRIAGRYALPKAVPVFGIPSNHLFLDDGVESGTRRYAAELRGESLESVARSAGLRQLAGELQRMTRFGRLTARRSKSGVVMECRAPMQTRTGGHHDQAQKPY